MYTCRIINAVIFSIRHQVINLGSRLAYILCLSFSLTKDYMVKVAKVCKLVYIYFALFR